MEVLILNHLESAEIARNPGVFTVNRPRNSLLPVGNSSPKTKNGSRGRREVDFFLFNRVTPGLSLFKRQIGLKCALVVQLDCAGQACERMEGHRMNSVPPGRQRNHRQRESRRADGRLELREEGERKRW